MINGQDNIHEALEKVAVSLKWLLKGRRSGMAQRGKAMDLIESQAGYRNPQWRTLMRKTKRQGSNISREISERIHALSPKDQKKLLAWAEKGGF